VAPTRANTSILSADQGTTALNQRGHGNRIGWSSISGFHGPIKISNSPSLGGRFIQVSRNEMQVKVLGSFAIGDGINAFASGDLLHKTACISHCTTPVGSLGRREIDGSGTVAECIQKKPTRKGSWIGVVAQHPKTRPLNFITLSNCRIDVQLTDGTVFQGDNAQRRTAPRPLPIKPKSITSPIKTTNSPLNEDTPPNDATAQQ